MIMRIYINLIYVHVYKTRMFDFVSFVMLRGPRCSTKLKQLKSAITHAKPVDGFSWSTMLIELLIVALTIACIRGSVFWTLAFTRWVKRI